MSSSSPTRPGRRAALALAAGAALAGCGLRPLYGDRGVGAGAKARLAAVEIGVIGERPGQILRNRLIDRFYGGTGPLPYTHELAVGLTVTEVRAGIRIDDTATRRLLTGSASVRLVEKGTQAVAYSASISRTSSFPFQEAQFGVLAARDAAVEDLMLALADEITTRVAFVLDRDG
jgi:LPS-assembly lipoprotein